MIVKLVTSFHYLHFNFRVNIYNEFNDNWHRVTFIFSLVGHVETLRTNCHKRRRIIQMKNLVLEFEVPFIFHVMLIIFSFLTYQNIKPHGIWWKDPKQSTHWDLIKIVWHVNLEKGKWKIFIHILYELCVTCMKIMKTNDERQT